MIDLYDNAVITGPFNFEPIYSNNNIRSKVNRNAWKIFHKTCTHRNMLPPTLGYQTSHQLSIQNYLRPGKEKFPQHKS